MDRLKRRFVNAAWRTWVGLRRPTRRQNLRQMRKRGESLDSLIIRKATTADIPALARLHVDTWNATYAPYGLKGPSVETRERQWRERFAANDPDQCCYVVQKSGGDLVGFAQGSRSDHPDYGAELGKLHLLRDYQRLGLGRQLIGCITRHFLSRGFRSMWLYGDARNPSCRAWVALGAEKCDSDPDSGSYGGETSLRLRGFGEDPAGGNEATDAAVKGAGAQQMPPTLCAEPRRFAIIAIVQYYGVSTTIGRKVFNGQALTSFSRVCQSFATIIELSAAPLPCTTSATSAVTV
jgi:ribosomal protein S18 acetylase RimI-like enzyme